MSDPVEAALSRRWRRVRHTLKLLGFKPFGKDILVMNPAMAYHDEVVKKLPTSLACPQ